MQENTIKVSEVFNDRFDPYYFRRSFVLLKKRLKASGAVYVGDIIKSWNRGDGPRQNFYTENKDDGVPFIRINNIRNHSIDISDIKYINRDIHEGVLKRTKLVPGDVVFAISGTKDNLGTVGVVPDFLLESNINSAILRLDLNNNLVDKYYFCYFFDLSLAKMQIDFIGKGAAQNNLNFEEVSEILIPLASLSVQRSIVSIMDNAYESKRQKEKLAESLLISIDDYVLSELGIKLPEYKKAKDFVVKSSIMLGGRYDPEYNQPYFSNYIKCLETNDNFESVPISDFDINSKLENMDSYDNINYVDLGSVNENIGNVLFTSIEKECFPSRARQKINKDDLLIPSLAGSIKSVALISEELPNMIASTGFFIIKPSKEYLTSYLFSLFKTTFIQNLLIRHTSGAVMPALNLEEFKSIRIPLPSMYVQEKIANKVQSIIAEAKRLKEEANFELEEAKQKVEKILLGEFDG